MTEHPPHRVACDPQVPSWQTIELPDTWPDRINFRRPAELLRVLRQVFGRRRAGVDLPGDIPGNDHIPKYALQEFHNLPNGNYSKCISRGYITGFERVMLGQLNSVRKANAQLLRDCQSVLDVGCAGGRMAAVLKDIGIDDVWAIDPSPYLLQHAAADNPGIKFIQGTAENTGFAANRFDGIAICFVLHEIPPRYFTRALQEFHRILKDGGKLVIAEPSSLQLRLSARDIFRRWGLRGLYFRLLAKRAHEPFLDAWHQQNLANQFAQHGFHLLSDIDDLPIRQLVAEKIAV